MAASRHGANQIGRSPGYAGVAAEVFHMARVYGERKKNFVGQHFWARGFLVSTVGREESVVREYIRNQEEEDRRLDQLNMWK